MSLQLFQLPYQFRKQIAALASRSAKKCFVVKRFESMDENKQNSRGMMSDLMIRRIKNRERQRKYRERKRLRDNAESYGYVENFARRVFCCRNWKQDARRVYLMNVTHSWRDWKREARNMKA